jgi:hypothetical protein
LQRDAVDGWKVEVKTDDDTGVCTHGGLEVIKIKQEQLYLGDVISTDVKHTQICNGQKEGKQCLGVITQIMHI